MIHHSNASIQNVDCAEDVQRQSHLNYQPLCGRWTTFLFLLLHFCCRTKSLICFGTGTDWSTMLLTLLLKGGKSKINSPELALVPNFFKSCATRGFWENVRFIRSNGRKTTFEWPKVVSVVSFPRFWGVLCIAKCFRFGDRKCRFRDIAIRTYEGSFFWWYLTPFPYQKAWRKWWGIFFS